MAFQAFHFAPGEEKFVSGQTTAIHNHPNPEQDSEQLVLVECASLVLLGPVRERTYKEAGHDDAGNKLAQKIGKEDRDAGSWRKVDNPGENLPHSIQNIGDTPALTLHAYTMHGLPPQEVAVQKKFRKFKNPNDEMHAAYNDLVSKLIAGETGGREAIPEISASGLQKALQENKFGDKPPVLVDIREPKEVWRNGALHLDGAAMLYVPRGVAVAKILQDFPDPDSSPHLLLSCRGGARSALLADELRTLGYKVTSVSDGANGCKKHGLTKEYDKDSNAIEEWSEGLDLTPSPKLAEHIERLKSDIPAITAEQLAQQLPRQPRKGKVVVFDVRQEHERSAGTIPHAQRVTAGEFEKKARFHANDFDQPIAIYSDRDGDYRALAAANSLRRMGYRKVEYLKGGYASYKKHIDLTRGLPATRVNTRS